MIFHYQGVKHTMKQISRIAIFLGMMVILTCSVMAEVKLANLFSDHMVLQRGMSVPIWGTATAGEQIVVTLAQKTVKTKAGQDGKWMVRFARLEAGGPFEMTVKGDNTLTVKDIYTGEVWLCSGQSNMEMSVAREDRYWCGVNNEAEEVASAKYPLIREYKVKMKLADNPQTDAEGKWSICSPETVGKFSATAYFFGRELHKKFNVPIGLVTSAFGASAAQAWIRREDLAANPDLAPLLEAYAKISKEYSTNKEVKEKYEQAVKKWEEDAAQAKAAGKPVPRRPRNPNPEQDQHNPCVLYNAMIIPLVPYAIRGAIWYQGESNYPTGNIYYTLMSTLIKNWRQVWNQGNFPFIYVQLAANKKPATEPCGQSEMAPVREGQLQTLQIPNTGMAVTIDIGDADNIHPKNKQELGRRLGLIAQALVYHQLIPYSGPLYKSFTIEGNSIRLSFDHTDGGLMAKGDKLTGFAIAGEDQKFVWADAKIDGNTVVVSSPQVAKPVAVCYGWADNPPVNLFNKIGLPASPFRTVKKQ